ncbi:formyltetrahydrofolate deformylase [Salimicrobium flavidum]|uniref:Formyltetrahydrofolate deformylase n=1 Tax=Salimicrobium flavidum TaxID=570947 RepID=A0A1N7KC43_9BACI|nr:formyltetrahydrofolate deformylase [Salimicrobium flavidum]SIS59142.1 formyltetrahydrofolate deformylase [Salimicrobium flavidum]
MTSYVEEKLQNYREKHKDRARLLIHCPDQPGIISRVSDFLFGHHANIVASHQYSTDPEGGEFFIRLEFDCPNLEEKFPQIEVDFQPIAAEFSMDWKMTAVRDLKNVAVFVSKQPHCLLELLWEWQSGDLMANLAVVISNHEDTREMVESLGIPFYHVPSNKELRQEAETRHKELLDEYNVDLIVLARYMQILTPEFVEPYRNKIINIHHSFLPAFVGARPYERAYERGVKMIGATSHYVTNDLDEGPIIEQDIGRVDHRDHVEEMKKIGQTIERSVLARAVKWHLADRILVHQNKTIVFS